jgi:hypothetical protein
MPPTGAAYGKSKVFDSGFGNFHLMLMHSDSGQTASRSRRGTAPWDKDEALVQHRHPKFYEVRRREGTISLRRYNRINDSKGIGERVGVPMRWDRRKSLP